MEAKCKFYRILKTQYEPKVSNDEVLESGQKVMVDGTSELTVQTPNHLGVGA